MKYGAHLRITLSRFIAAAAAAAMLASTASAGGLSSLWVLPATSGTWEDAVNWQNSPNVSAYPNNGGGNSFAVDTGNSGVTIGINSPITVDSVRLATGRLGINAGGSLTVGAFNWSGTTQLSGPGTLFAQGSSTISGAVTLLTTIENSGTINVSGSTSQVGGGVLNNTANGTFNLSGDGGGNSWETHNQGVLNKTGAGITSLTGGFFNENAGVVNVTAGTLSLTAAGSYGGTSSIAVNGGALIFQNASHTFTGSASITGAGTVLIASGASGVFNAATTNVGAPVTLRGSVTGSGTVRFGDVLTWESGSMSGAGTTVALVDLYFGNAGTITNARTLTLLEDSEMHGAGTLDNTGTLEIAKGLSIFTDADISGGSGGTLHVAAGATLGKFTATGDTFISCRFNNDGQLTVGSGRVILDSAGTNTGQFNISDGATLRLSNNFRTFSLAADGSGGISGTGTGTLEFFAGTSDFNDVPGGDVDTYVVNAVTTMNGGVMGGSAFISFGKLFTWNAGKMTGTGTSSMSSFEFATTATKTNERIIQLTGSGFWRDGNINNSLSTIVSAATFNIALNAPANLSSGTFENYGTIKNLGPSVATISAFLKNPANPPSPPKVQATGARLKLSGGGEHAGQFSGTISGTLDFAGGVHTFHAGASITGEVDYTAGTCTFAEDADTSTGGAVVQLSGNTINNAGALKLDAATAQYYGRFSNTGIASMSGTSEWGGVFENTGTVQLTGTINFVVNASNAGTFHVAQSGHLNGVGFTFTNNAQLEVLGVANVNVLNFGTLSGRGQVLKPVTNSGVCSPGQALGADVDTLQIDTFTQTSSGQYRAQVIDATTADDLFVTETITLGGTLRVDLAEEFYLYKLTIAPSAVITIAEAVGTQIPVSGSFSNVASGGRIMTSDGAASFRVYYGSGSPHPPHKVVLTDFRPEVTPLVTTGAADTITQTGATLHGTINPRGFAGTAKFVYGTTNAYGSETSSVNIPVGNSAVPVDIAISGLQPFTLYHFRLVGTNAAGDSLGGDLTFTTLPNPPTVVTQAATDITPSSATLHGTVNPNGVVPAAQFQIGKTNAYGTSSDLIYLNASTTAQSTQTTVQGLKAHTVYHFRLTATTNGGTSAGQDLTFTTTNTAPEAEDDVAYGAGPDPIEIAVLANDSDADGDTLTIKSVTQGTFGKITHNGTKITYTPKTKYQRTDQFTYTISDGAETATATVVVRQSFMESAGAFDGLVTNTAPNNDNQGYLRATVTSSGSCTGKLSFGGFTHGFSGTFENNGRFTKTIKRPAPLAPLTLDLTLDPAAKHLAGTITDGSVVSQTDATQTPYSAANQPLQLGKYTLGLPANAAHPEPEFPQGDGYATMEIGNTGTVTVKGKLGDGTAFSSSSLLKSDHSFALYAGLYVNKPTRRGSVVGGVNVGPAAAINLTAALRWYKSAQIADVFYKPGFATEIALTGSRYVVTKGVSVLGLPGGNGQCTIGAGNIAAPFGLALAVTAADKVTTPAPNARLFDMTIARNTGLVSGHFNVTLPNGKAQRRSFYGVVLQDQHKAIGHFLGTDQSGYVRVEP